MSDADIRTLDEARAQLDAGGALSGGYRERRPLAKADAALPLVSIVTVTFNAEKTLAATIESVKAQHYRNIEHIVVDGGSTDGTIDIIRANEDAIAFWRSEPDDGIYDAFNKGIALSSGEYIGILNADDYYEPDQIARAVEALRTSDVPFVHGDITLHGWQGTDLELHGDPYYDAVIRHRMPSLHQVTTLCRRSVFQDHGLFSTRYRIAGDYDWYLRLAKRGCVGQHVPGIHAHMRAGGISTTRQRRAFFEALLITWRHGLPLRQAVCITAPKIALPNGNPAWVSRLAAAGGRRVATFRRLFAGARRRLMRLVRRTDDAGLPLVDAFAAARHLSLDIQPIGLEWLYRTGSKARTFARRCASANGKVVALMLSAGGCRETEDIDSADVVVAEDEREQLGLVARLAPSRTIVLVAGNVGVERMELNWPSLDFGGFRSLGVLVNLPVDAETASHDENEHGRPATPGRPPADGRVPQ